MVDPTLGRSRSSGQVPARPLVRRHIVLVAITALLVTGGAYLFASLQKPSYTSQASVLVEPFTLPNTANPAPDLGTEQAIALSGVVLGNVAHALDTSLQAVSAAASVTPSTNADVLDFAYSAPTPTAATRGATALAAAYMAYRLLTTTSANTKTNVVQTLATPKVKTRLISSATVPGSPSSPDVVIDVIAGVIVGLVAGLAVAFAADRFGKRLRTLNRWQEATGVPVLAGLERETVVEDPETAHSRDNTALVLRYLRTRVAQLVHRGGAVVLVTEVTEQPERAAIARLLANGLAHTGWSAAFVELTRDLTDQDDHDRAGDLRVRESSTSLTDAALRPAGDWRAVSLTELLQRIERVGAEHDVVVVTGPPISTSVTTLDVAAVADIAIVIDNVATARRIEARRVVAELRAAGCRIGGAVLLGLSAARTGDAAAVAEVRPRDTPDAPPAAPRPPRRIAAPLIAWTEFEAGAADEPTHDHVNGSRR